MTDKQVALITGASGGLGFEVAKKYIDAGFHVVSVGRSQGKLEELDDYARDKGMHTTIVVLDLLDYPKIAELGQKIAEKFGCLDVLISCAAMLGELSPLDHYNFKIWERVIATNVTANWHLIKTMNPLLQQSKADSSYALFSICHEAIDNPYWGAYSVSQAALKNLVNIYSGENQKTKLNVKSIDPGAMGTKLRKLAMPGYAETHWPSPDLAADLFINAIME